LPGALWVRSGKNQLDQMRQVAIVRRGARRGGGRGEKSSARRVAHGADRYEGDVDAPSRAAEWPAIMDSCRAHDTEHGILTHEAIWLNVHDANAALGSPTLTVTCQLRQNSPARSFLVAAFRGGLGLAEWLAREAPNLPGGREDRPRRKRRAVADDRRPSIGV